jgi:hypothetical protein
MNTDDPQLLQQTRSQVPVIVQPSDSQVTFSPGTQAAI